MVNVKLIGFNDNCNIYAHIMGTCVCVCMYICACDMVFRVKGYGGSAKIKAYEACKHDTSGIVSTSSSCTEWVGAPD